MGKKFLGPSPAHPGMMEQLIRECKAIGLTKKEVERIIDGRVKEKARLEGWSAVQVSATIIDRQTQIDAVYGV
jgi:hypothetical protein